jgi:acid phosphatase type 7
MKPSPWCAAFALFMALAGTSACGSDSPTSPGPVGETAVLVGAGDIGQCGSPGPAATADLLNAISGTVFTAGDNAYMQGSAENFRDCYDPSWGRHRTHTRPTPGNHDYETPGAAGYFDYFGRNAGPDRLGYYSYEAGGWLVLALNSEVPASEGSAQLAWLRDALGAGRSARCAIAYWHRPVFSSGPNGDSASMRDVWRTLQNFSADVVVTGHDHLYERFAPQTIDGVPDAERGIRQFVVGTGGASLTQPRGARRSTSEAISSTWGVLKLTLRESTYDWEFVPAAGSSFRDSGSGVCH